MQWARTVWRELYVNKAGTTRLVHVSHAPPSRRQILGAKPASTARRQRDASILTTFDTRRHGYARFASACVRFLARKPGFWRREDAV